MRDIYFTPKTSEKISVVVCTYNGQNYLADQLESILSQSRFPDEVVVADDGSTDSTMRLLKDFSELSPFPVRLLPSLSKRLGVTKNFERAISACNGSVIALADQDDVWKTEKLQSMLTAFDANPGCGYVFSDAKLIDSSGKPLGDATLWSMVGFEGARRQHYEEKNQLPVMLRGGSFVYGMAMAFRADLRDLLLPITSNSADCTHDTWIATLLSAAGHPGIALPNTLVAYRQHAHQVVGAGEHRAGSLSAARHALRSGRRTARTLADDYQAMADRLRQAGPYEVAVQCLCEKALHLKQRQIAIETARLFRLRCVATELLTGRYALYSTSWKSALRDLIA
jgi:hypothetical protein